MLPLTNIPPDTRTDNTSFDIPKKQKLNDSLAAEAGCTEKDDIVIDISSVEEKEEPKNAFEQLSEKVNKLEKEIHSIIARNNRVEHEKAFETSYTRKIVIAGVTYLASAAFFNLIETNYPYLNALVPSGAYLLSTLPGCRKIAHCTNNRFCPPC